MAKKKVVRKKKAAVAKKLQKENDGSRWVLPAIILIFIVLAAFVVAMQKPEWFKFLSIKRAGSFSEGMELVNKIDRAHNISFSDYSRGIYYLSSHPRYPNPLNFEEMDKVTGEYQTVVGDDAVNLLADFRSYLVEAEKYYRLSGKTYKSNLDKYGVSCKNAPDVNESIGNKLKSIENINLMLGALENLKQNHTQEYNSLNLSEVWVNKIAAEAVDFRGEIKYNQDLWNRFCGNKTAKNQSPENTIKSLLPSSWNITVTENTRPDVWGGSEVCKYISVENPAETVPSPAGNMTARQMFWFCPTDWKGQEPANISPVAQTYPAFLLCNCTDYQIFTDSVGGIGGNSTRDLPDKVKAAFS